MKYFKKLLIAAVLILVLPTVLRLNRPLPGIESYYFIAQLPGVPDYFFRAVPLLFSLLSSLVFYFLLGELGFRKDVAGIATLLLLVSTPFIYVSNMFTPHALFLLINLTAFYLYFRKDRHLYLLSIPLFLVTGLFGAYSFITLIFLVLCTIIFERNRGLSFSLAIVVLLLAFASSPLSWFRPEQGYLQLLVSDFGGSVGIGVSALILAFFGFLKTWKNKYQFFPVYVAVILLFAASKYLFFATIYLNLPIVVFAAKAMNELLTEKWALKFIKQISVIALACTFLFSAVSFVNRIYEEQPSDVVVKSLVFLRGRDQGVVFSHQSKGFWISHYSNKPVFIDRMSINPHLENISNQVYYSRSYQNTTKIFDEHNIRYIWIDGQMKNGQVWTKPEQGLLFLFLDKKVFAQIYENKGIEIWEYLPVQQKTI
jgi:hypothetical protein